MRVLSPVLSLLLSLYLTLNPLWAQTSLPGTTQSGLPSPLQLHVVDDPGPALANSTAAKGYIIQVSDSSGSPLSGAAVAVRLPEENPTGRFGDGLRAWVAYTNSAGIATFPVIRWHESAGFVELRVTAAKGSMHAGLVIQQQIRVDHPAPAVAATLTPVLVPHSAPSAAPVLSPAIVPPTNLRIVPPPLAKISLPEPEPAAVATPLADVVPPPLSPSLSKSGAAAPKLPLSPNPPPPAQAQDKTVSIVNLKTGAGGSSHGGKKWLIIAAVGTGAGVGILMGLKDTVPAALLRRRHPVSPSARLQLAWAIDRRYSDNHETSCVLESTTLPLCSASRATLHSATRHSTLFGWVGARDPRHSGESHGGDPAHVVGRFRVASPTLED